MPFLLPRESIESEFRGNPTDPSGPSSIDKFAGFCNLHKFGSENIDAGEIFGLLEGETTPLFQTNLFPDLMQVNFKPEKLEVAPNLLHVAPALIAASDVGNEVRAISNERKIAKRFMALVLQLIHHIHSICTF